MKDGFDNLDSWTHGLVSELDKHIFSKILKKKEEPPKPVTNQIPPPNMQNPLMIGRPMNPSHRIIGDPMYPHGHPFGGIGGN